MINNDDDYSQSDIDRMRFYYKELEDLYLKYPGSFTIRNGLARLDQILGHTVKYTPIDFSQELDQKIQQEKDKIKLNRTLGI